MRKIEELDYITLDHKELAKQVGMSDNYLGQLIELLLDDPENEQNQVAIQMLGQIERTLHQLRAAYYGRIIYNDGTWKYGDKVESSDMSALLAIEKDIGDEDGQ